MVKLNSVRLPGTRAGNSGALKGYERPFSGRRLVTPELSTNLARISERPFRNLEKATVFSLTNLGAQPMRLSLDKLFFFIQLWLNGDRFGIATHPFAIGL
jgi:hypothetical protein